MNLLSRGVRNALRSPARTVAVVVILGLTTGLSFVMLVGHQSVENKISATLATLGTSVEITPAGYGAGSAGHRHLTTSQLQAVARLPHVVNLAEVLPDALRSRRAAGRSAGPQTSLRPASAGQPVGFAGTNAPTQPATIGASTLRIVAGRAVAGTSDADQAMVSTALARRSHLQVGSRFRAYGAVFTVKAIFTSDSASGNDTVIVPLATEQRLSHRRGEVGSAVATVDSLAHLSAVTAAITLTLGPAADVTSDVGRAGQALAPLNSVRSLSLYSLLGAAATAAVVIFLVMVMTVRERKREVGTMKAIGGSSASITGQFMAEALTLAALGGVAGLAAGALAAGSITTSLVGGHHQLHATATLPEVLTGLAGILLIAALGSAAAAYLTSRIQPAQALRSD
jgi:putative ABC transport system permease protein